MFRRLFSLAPRGVLLMPTQFIDQKATTAQIGTALGAAGIARVGDALYFRNSSGALRQILDDSNAASAFVVAGVAAGYKLARGEAQQGTASDTVVTGLATVVAAVVSPRTVTVKQLFFSVSIGDQAGTPAAGSILILSKKPTAVNDVTPTAATDFTDNIKVNWIAIGT